MEVGKKERKIGNEILLEGERAIASDWWGIPPPQKKRTKGDREDRGDHHDLPQY
jgi:hypothetical protein